jgi:hypothetical protein
MKTSQVLTKVFKRRSKLSPAKEAYFLFSNFKIVKLFVVKAYRFFLKTEIEITPAGSRPGSDCPKVTPSPSNFFAFPFPSLRDIAIRNTFAANCARFDS